MYRGIIYFLIFHQKNQMTTKINILKSFHQILCQPYSQGTFPGGDISTAREGYERFDYNNYRVNKFVFRI